ncbi:MAG TPA: MFS transporter, partial [Actinomycetota bacterium]|nr:MFS transporter [Actinomycetota bacterium]
NTLFVLYVAQKFGWNAAQSGLLLTAFAAGNIVVMGVITPRLSRRLGEWTLMIAGLALSAVGFVALGLAPTPALFCLACVLPCLGNVCGPPMRALQTLTVSAAEQGRLQGVLGGLGALTALIGPFAFTQLYAWSLLQPGSWSGLAMLGAAGLMAMATVVGLATRRPTA